MVTRAFSVPGDFRPRELAPGPNGGAAWLVVATERLTYGVGAPDLARYVAVVSQRWCPAAGRVVELELFFPKESITAERAQAELAAFSCAGAYELPAAAAASGEERAILELVRRLEAQGRLADGVAALRRGLAAHARSASLRIKLADLLRRTGGFDEAMHYYAEARALDPGRAEAYFNEGYSRLFAGETGKAEEVFKAAVAASSGSAVSLHHLATSLWYRGERAAALESLGKAVARFESEGVTDDDYAHALLWLITMREATGGYGLEELARKAAAAARPGSYHSHFAYARLAALLAERGDSRGAQAALAAANAHCRTWGCSTAMKAMAEAAHARALLAAGDEDGARVAALKARRLALADPNVGNGTGNGWAVANLIDVLLRVADVSLLLGDARAAADAYAEAEPFAARIPAHPSAALWRERKAALESREAEDAADLEAALGRAQSLMRKGDYDGALMRLIPLSERALREWGGADPRTARALGRRAWSAHEARRARQVREAERLLEAIRPQSPDTLLARARIRRLAGDLSRAAALAERALPGGEESYIELALCRVAQSRVDSAVAALRRGLAAYPRSAGLRVKLADLLRFGGGFKEAMSLYAEARALDPGRDEAYFQEGYSRQFAGETDEASELFRAAVAASTGSAAAHHHLGSSQWSRGRLEEGVAEMEEARRLLEADPQASAESYAHTLGWLAKMYAQLGRPGVEELLRQVISLSHRGSRQRYVGYVRLAGLLSARGEHAAARAQSDLALGECERWGCPPIVEGRIWSERALAERAAGEAAAARRAADRARALVLTTRTDKSPAVFQELQIVLNCARTYRELGDRTAARAALDAARPLATTIPGHPPMVIFRYELEAFERDFGTTPARPRGLVLISVDALRADRVGARRGREPLMPVLDALAGRAVVFEQAVSQAPWTLPSMASAFTSLPPSRHGLTNRFASFGEDSRELARLPASAATVAEGFKRAGFDTAAFTGDAGLDKVYGFDRGFDVYFDSTPFAGFETTAPLALRWLQERGARPFFLFLHGYDVHGQHPVPAGFRSRFADPRYAGPYAGTGDEFLALRRAVVDGAPRPVTDADRAFWSAHYDERVRRADGRLGDFLAALSTDVVVAVMSDHGEELFERGGVDHGMTLYDEAIRVPLLVRAPGFAPRRVPEQVRLLDLAPTLLDLMGVSDPAFSAQAKGLSLRPLMEGRPAAPRDALSETDFLFRASKRSLRGADGRKLIFDLETLHREVYDLKADPGETRDLAPGDPKGAAALEARLRVELGLPAN